MLTCDETAETTQISDLETPLSLLLKAAGDELRLQILKVLSRDSFGVLELCTVFDVKQSALSHHLKVLAKAGLVTTRREGNSIFYRRAHTLEPQALLGLQQSILQASDLICLSETITNGIAKVQHERTENSQKFFSDNTDKFKAQQDLIAGLEQYGPSVTELIQTLPNKHTALEIGPGEGVFLPTLSEAFDKVLAVEISPEMHQKCLNLRQEMNLNNAEILLGDSSAAAALSNIDCVVANMVLHHTPNPGEIFQDLSQCLTKGGSLIVCDLLSHDQSWARENCGDVWLGFDESELTQWANAAGLSDSKEHGQEIFLTLRNGFRIQVREFIKH